MKWAILVPGRLASQRFPRKLLHPIRGVPLIVWTARRLREIASECELCFAVDSEELAEVLRHENFSTVLTDPELPSGTDRIAVAARTLGDVEAVINVQADEPLVTSGQIEALRSMIEAGAAMATLGTPFQSIEDWRDPNRVKVLHDNEGQALYFSRSPLPCFRDQIDASAWGQVQQQPVLLHLGLYAYRRDFLDTFVSLPAGRLEQAEKLEQLRALESGHRIAVARTKEHTQGIDTPEDVQRFVAQLDTMAD